MIYKSGSHSIWVRGLKQTGTLSILTRNVALYMGAWIETVNYNYQLLTVFESHSIWVRGLKLGSSSASSSAYRSHSIWVRGLKPF